MDSLILHIEYLLRHHDCVILPGFGAFIAYYESARYDSESRIFFPPHRKICFNADIANDDGLLVNSIRRKLCVDFEEARIVMHRYVKTLATILKEDNEVSLGKIGTLRLSSENHISFFPAYSANILNTLAGFSPVSLLNLQPTQKETETDNKDDIKVIKPQHPDVKLRPFNPNNYYLPINKIFAKVAASIIVVLAIAASFIIPLNHPELKAPEMVEASLAPTNMAQGKEAIKTKIKEAVSLVSEDQNVNHTDNIQDSEDPVNHKKYHLIVASFHSPIEAENFIKSKPSDKFDLTIEKKNKLWLVSAAQSNSKETLQEISHKSEFLKEFTDFWYWSPDK